MSVNHTHVDAPPEAVYAVLSDPYTYAHWVVGASETRYVEGDWPQAGATFHHTQGLPKVGPKDTTSVLESELDRRVKMCVRIRPFVIAVVDMKLEPAGGGTDVTMIEEPVGGIAGKIHNPVFDALFHARNIESLRRLKKLAERRGARAATSPKPR